ncbi:hypothetical protein G9A89_017154 [Geosiphon pyriformis]|nr:hypothetical protein G9A89_017154 [Geosiphon pyriformis]
MDPVGSFAGASSSSSAELGFWSGSKKIKAHVESVYSHGLLYKKTKLPGISGGIIDLSNGLILVDMLYGNGVGLQRSWGSKVDSEKAGVSKVSDVKNLESTIAKETNYMDPNTFETDKMEDDMTPRKTQTRTLILEQPPKAISFTDMSDDDTKLVLPGAKFARSNWLSSVILCVLEHCVFEPVKLFVLDVELSNVSGKTNSDKLILIKKIFYRIDGFGEALTSLKFPGIIWSTFTSGSSLNKARKMAINKKIIVNDGLKKINNCSDQEIIIKEIPIDLLKSMIEAVFSKFGKIISIKMQLIGLWQKALVEFESTETACLDSVHVALAISDKKLWILRNHYRTLLYTLLVGITAYNLFELVEAYGGKTCFIGRNPSLYVHNKCAVICFESKAFKLAAIGFVSVFKGVSLQWAGLSLASCIQCKQFGHITINCSLVFSDQDRICLAGIYKKKLALIFHSMSFAGKTWAQVAGSLNSRMALSSSGSGSLLAMVSPSQFSLDVNNRFAALEHSLVSLAKQVNKLAKRLNALGPMVFQHGPRLDTVISEGSGAATSNGTVVKTVVYNSSAVSKLEDTLDILSKTVMGLSARLENAGLATCNVRGINNFAKQEDIVHWHKNLCNLVSILMETKLKNKTCPWLVSKFDGIRVFSSGLVSDYTGAGVMMVLDNFLAKHVSKVSEVFGCLLCIKLLFKNKFLVSILGLYAGVSLTAWFFQAVEINSLIAKAVNESSFIILSGDFNEDSSRKCASLKKCFDLGLLPTWCNSCGVTKTINYMFISSNLIGAVVDRSVAAVNNYFDTDHKAVSVSMGLGGLLDVQLNFLHKQANRDCWKYNFMNANKDMAANAAMFCDEFGATGKMCLSTESVFKKKWFKNYDSVFNKTSSRFHKLELLVLRIVKVSHLASHDKFVFLFGLWNGLDSTNTSVVKSLFLLGSHFNAIRLVLAKIRKSYHLSKLLAIDKRIKSFELNKGHTIRSVLECPFHKVVLDYLMVSNELILEFDLVKSKVVTDVSSDWNHQYQLLDYVFDEAFSGVMSSISFDELFKMVSGLPDGKAAGLSGISNELWKHCDRSVLDMFLKEAWVSMIPKPYEWEGVLTNMHPIALIETAHKILSKIFSDQILLTCSMFDVFCSDNFSVLKGISTQSLIFAVGSIVEDALEKNRELWLILQDMKKEHLSKCLVRIKMCDKFIQFFSVMTDFGLMSGYHVHNGLDQGEVFFSLLWRIFYDPLLCEINDCAESQVRFSTFFAAGVFIDDTIWVSSSLRTTQHILNIASEFFRINDISINNDKTVAIFINSRVSNSSLFISGLPIFIARKGESHQYLGIFFSTESLSKPSLVKAYSDIHFFTNLVLRKTITDKQLLYLVLVVLYPIVDAMIRKALKLKSGLPLDFSGDMIHHPFFYGLNFVNSSGILGCLFSHRSYDLQVLCWHPVHQLSCLVRICVNASNNFLAGLVCVLFNCNLFLNGSLANVFCFNDGVPILAHYGIAFVDQLCDHHDSVFSWYAFKQWKKLDPRRPIPNWFRLSAAFFDGVTSSSAFFSVLNDVGPLNILGSGEFLSVCDCLSHVETGCLSVYTDGSLRNLDMVSCKAGTAAFFEDVGLDLGIGMLNLMSSTLVELQVIALALECISSFNSVCLFSDSQSALDACKLELGLLCPDFHIKDYSGMEENEQADVIAGSDSFSSWFFPSCLDEHFLVANDVVIFGNSRHFVRDVFCFISHTHWEIGSEVKFLMSDLVSEIDWSHSSLVWHLDLHMTTGFTSKISANVCTYFMKALHYRLLVAVHKHLYNRSYLSVLCLYCGEVEVSNHVFSCGVDDSA